MEFRVRDLDLRLSIQDVRVTGRSTDLLVFQDLEALRRTLSYSTLGAIKTLNPKP